ncbi:hypothetical protein HDU96_007558 [Phlyctochytrium bullatum]|nr:hypothetical protein HDU96_007558 [Phlyctochytrium bullatum]
MSTDERNIKALHQLISRDNQQRPRILDEGKCIPIENHPDIVVREAVPADLEPLSKFNGFVHGDVEMFEGCIRILMGAHSGPARHPVIDHRLFLVVVDRSFQPSDPERLAKLSEDDRKYLTHDGLVVSTTLGIPQVWTYGEPDPTSASSKDSYAGKEVGSGDHRVPIVAYRVEAVSTHPDYRSRNLLQPQFDLHHLAAEKLSADLCFVAGLKGFYRKFGYDLVSRIQVVGAYLPHIPQREGSTERFPVPVGGDEEQTLPDRSVETPSRLGSVYQLAQVSWGLAEGEPYVIRRATVSDAPFLAQAARRTSDARMHWSSDASELWWANLVDGRELEAWPAPFQRRDVYIIEEAVSPEEPKEVVPADDVRLGFIQISPPEFEFSLLRLELDPSRVDHSWTSVAPTVLRWMCWAALERERDKVRFANVRRAQEASQSGTGTATEVMPLPTRLNADFVFQFSLALKHHPLFRSLGFAAQKFPTTLSEDALFIRIASLPRLLRRLAPVLSARLAKHAVFRGFTGSIVVCSTPGDVARNGGAVIRIRRGAIDQVVVPGEDTEGANKTRKSVEEVVSEEEAVIKAFFEQTYRSSSKPDAVVSVFCAQANPLLFVQLVMGNTGAAELLKRYPGDVWTTKDGLSALLLDAMFGTENEGAVNAEEIWLLD